MVKKLILKLALGLVLDVLIGVATKKYNEANAPTSKEKWLNIIEFLGEVKHVGLP